MLPRGENLGHMCGIAGILTASDGEVSLTQLHNMANALAHRGPDDCGFYTEGPVGFAHRRLSILDLTSAGHQPMSNEDGTVWIVYNGQLYDFFSTRERLERGGHQFRSRTDTEVVLHLYEERGEAFLDRIDGMYALAIWDSRRRRLLLARDRLGIKPLYYVREGSTVAFASELKALLVLPWVSREIDPLGLVHYLYQSSVPDCLTAIKGIQKLGAAECLIFEGGASRQFRYWSVAPSPESKPEPFEEAATALQARLTASVESQLVSDVPIGTFLSGGLDSAAVTAAAVARSGQIHSFSVRFPGLQDYDEGAAARQVSDALGTVHHELELRSEQISSVPEVVRQCGEPFAVSSALAVFHLARFARQWVKVVLTGDGADEILGGYPWRHEPEFGSGASPGSFFRSLARVGARSVRGACATGPGLGLQLRARLGRLRRPDERYAELIHAFTPEEMERVLAPDLVELAYRAWGQDPIRRRYREGATADEVNRRLWTELGTTLVDEMLTKLDRMTMASGLEARVPFLDRTLVEWAFRQPGAYKVRRGWGKLLLRHALRESLPRIATRAKHGFNLPLGDWLRGPLRELLLDTLSASAVKRRGFFRPEAVARLVHAHLSGRGDYSRKIFNLLVLEIWCSDIASDPLTSKG